MVHYIDLLWNQIEVSIFLLYKKLSSIPDYTQLDHYITSALD